MATEKSMYVKNSNINSRDVKNSILKYLHNNVSKVNIKFEIISKNQDLEIIKNNNYIICPRFVGVRTWIIFFHIDDHFYAVNFPKHHINKREELHIFPIHIGIDKTLYRGTIMEGIYYSIDNSRYLVIDEVYLLAGENQLIKSKDDRLSNLDQILKKHLIHNDRDFYITVSQVFETNQNSLMHLYEKIKADTKIQDIIFYPKIYGGKIFQYSIIESDTVDHVIKLSKFYLKKTKNTDVYHLLSIDSKKKIDIAYIPDIDTSQMCKRWFKENKTSELFVKCQMDMMKNKWIPIEIVEEELTDSDIE